MCKFNPKNNGRRLDPCMKSFIINLNEAGIDTFGCCCGHKKYPMTVICREINSTTYYDLISGIIIPRKKKFYKKDKDGYYYIPEVLIK